jgi:RNA polymerase sigma-70 factor (sigma-E family)
MVGSVRESKLEAFDRLCRDEYASVVRTAYLITGDREEATDLAQEAFARAYERWKSVSRMDRPGGWLQRVVANLAISWRRRRRAVPEDRIDDRSAGVADPEGSDLDLMEALSSLTPGQRAAIVLRYYADQPVAAVARALGKRPGTVRALTSQGLARLREFMAQEEEEDEARR